MPFCDFIFDNKWLDGNPVNNIAIYNCGSIIIEKETELNITAFVECDALQCVRFINANITLEDFNKIIDRHIEFIRLMCENSGMLIKNKPVRAITLNGNSNQYCIITGGNSNPGLKEIAVRTNDVVGISPWKNFEVLIKAIAASDYKYAFYLNRVVNVDLPKEYRWLNAYKIPEEYYGGSLGRNRQWDVLCELRREKWGHLLDDKKQSMRGMLESIRNICAHAICDYRPKKEIIELSFPLICELSTEILELIKPKGFKFKWVAQQVDSAEAATNG